MIGGPRPPARRSPPGPSSTRMTRRRSRHVAPRLRLRGACRRAARVGVGTSNGCVGRPKELHAVHALAPTHGGEPSVDSTGDVAAGRYGPDAGCLLKLRSGSWSVTWGVVELPRRVPPPSVMVAEPPL